MAKFWNFKVSAKENTEELHIDGDILDDDEAWLCEWFGIACTHPNAFRQELKKRKGKCIDVWINSPGGSVFAGAGIYNALREHDGNVNMIVDGIAASAASVIAMAGDTVQMTSVGMLMIHNPLTRLNGWVQAKDLRKCADVLDKIAQTIINAYALRTKLGRAELERMMDDETYMTAGDAVRLGFADSVRLADGEKPEVVNCLFGRKTRETAEDNCLRDAVTRIAAKLGAEDALAEVAERVRQEAAKAKADAEKAQADKDAADAAARDNEEKQRAEQARHLTQARERLALLARAARNR